MSDTHPARPRDASDARGARTRQPRVPPTPAAAVRHDLLLGAAAHAAEVLTSTPDLRAALAEAGRVLGEATGVDRVNVFRYDHARAAGSLHAEWARPGVTPLSAVDPGPYADADYAEVMRPLRAGQVYHAPLAAKTGANAALNAATQTKTDLFVPVLVDGRFWGMLNFDDCTTERAWSDGEVEVLRAAAAAVAAAVRREALERAHAEAIAREREQAAEARAAELARRNALLAVALDASRALIEAVDLGAACDHVLAALGPALAADRAALCVVTPAADGGAPWCELRHEWTAPGVPRQADGPGRRRTRLAGSAAQRAAFLTGEPVQATLDALPEPARTEQAAAGVRAAFAVPILVDGRTWGVLEVDDCRRVRTWDAEEVGFLRIVAAALAAAAQRRRAERERAEAVARERERVAAERLAVLGRTNDALRRGTERIAAHAAGRDAILDWCLLEALDATGAAAGAVVRRVDLDGTACDMRSLAQDGALVRPFDPHASAEGYRAATARDAAGVMRRTMDGETFLYDVAEVAAWFPEAHAYHVGRGHGVVGHFPLLVADAVIGYLGLAWRGPDAPAAEAVETGRTLTLQAALALETQRLADEAREAAVAREREQAADARAAVLRVTNTALAKRLHLVEAAVESADALLAAAAVADAMPAVLARAGGVLGADRALLMRFEPPDAATQLGWAILDHEWAAPGVPRQGDDPALARLKLDHYADVVHRLHAERFVEIHTSDLPDAGRAEQEATGARSQVVLSVLVRGQVWGFLGFDDCHADRAWDEAEIGLMQIVTASLGGAIERETLAAERAAAERAVLAEREQAAEARAVELARVNAALREPLAALARGEGVGGLLSSILSEAARQAGADHAAVFLHDADADVLRLVGACVDGGAVAQPGEAPWLVPFAAPVPVAEAPSWSVLGAAAEPWLVHPVADTVLTWPGTRAMHEAAGHATLGYVRLQVGGRPLGFVGLAWRAASPALTPDQRGVVTALAQQLALALELDRLAATAAAEQRQAAVLEERTRLAREIHDTLAQGLAGIVMQLRAARATLGPLEGASTPALDRVERLARENLVEARRSLAMLRPAALDRGGLDVALRDLVSAARDTSEVGTRARGGGPGEIRYEVLGTPIPLPADVEMELLRIAQAALTNAVQHAAASAVHVELAYERRRAAAGASDGRAALATDGVRLAVTDDGRGFDGDDVPSGRFGLLGMSERAVRVGAVLTVVTAPGEGTQVVVMWRATPGGTA